METIRNKRGKKQKNYIKINEQQQKDRHTSLVKQCHTNNDIFKDNSCVNNEREVSKITRQLHVVQSIIQSPIKMTNDIETLIDDYLMNNTSENIDPWLIETPFSNLRTEAVEVPVHSLNCGINKNHYAPIFCAIDYFNDVDQDNQQDVNGVDLDNQHGVNGVNEDGQQDVNGVDEDNQQDVNGIDLDNQDVGDVDQDNQQDVNGVNEDNQENINGVTLQYTNQQNTVQANKLEINGSIEDYVLQSSELTLQNSLIPGYYNEDVGSSPHLDTTMVVASAADTTVTQTEFSSDMESISIIYQSGITQHVIEIFNATTDDCASNDVTTQFYQKVQSGRLYPRYHVQISDNTLEISANARRSGYDEICHYQLETST